MKNENALLKEKIELLETQFNLNTVITQIGYKVHLMQRTDWSINSNKIKIMIANNDFGLQRIEEIKSLLEERKDYLISLESIEKDIAINNDKLNHNLL